MPTLAAFHPPATSSTGKALRTLAQGVLVAFGVALVCTAVTGVRFLVFEYHHGAREMVMQILDRFL